MYAETLTLNNVARNYTKLFFKNNGIVFPAICKPYFVVKPKEYTFKLSDIVKHLKVNNFTIYSLLPDSLT